MSSRVLILATIIFVALISLLAGVKSKPEYIVLEDTILHNHLIKIVDRNQDGLISSDEASFVTEIDFPAKVGSRKRVETLEGIDRFTQLTVLKLHAHDITSVDLLPPKLRTLDLSANKIRHLGALPESLKVLRLSYSEVETIEMLPQKIEILEVERSPFLLWLPNFPETLRVLKARQTGVRMFPDWSHTRLEYIDIRQNDLGSLPDLPLNLIYLLAENNSFTSLPELKHLRKLKLLRISDNLVMEILEFPPQIQKWDLDKDPKILEFGARAVLEHERYTLDDPLPCTFGECLNVRYGAIELWKSGKKDDSIQLLMETYRICGPGKGKRILYDQLLSYLLQNNRFDERERLLEDYEYIRNLESVGSK